MGLRRLGLLLVAAWSVAPVLEPLSAAAEPGSKASSDGAALPRGGSPRNGAKFVSQTALPPKMAPGQEASVSIRMINSGSTAWLASRGYKLGSQSPADNSLWRRGRVALPAGIRVAPGAACTFAFSIRAPEAPGVYSFRWRMVRERVEWFGQLTPEIKVTVEGSPTPTPTPTPTPVQRRTGPVRLKGWSLADDQGPFNAVGFTLMSGLRLYKFNREQLATELAAAGAAGYHFARVLSMVGAPPYWQGREVDPELVKDRSWADYDTVLAEYLDYSYSKGIRTELTLFADAQVMAPGREARRRHVDRIIRIVRPRMQTIAYLEVANEPWQNGFDGSPDELAEYGRMLKAALPDAAVALGAPQAGREEDFGKKGFPMSLHLDRDIGKADGMWRPVRQPWEGSGFGPTGWTNNEPIGPGSSVAEDRDCGRLRAHVMTTFISKGFAFVFHSAAGVRSIPDRGLPGLVSEMPCFKEAPQAAALLPADLPNFARQNGHWAGSPFKNLDEFIEGGVTGRRGVMRIYSGTSGDALATVLLHLPQAVKLECRVGGPVAVIKLEPLGAEQTVDCAPGKTFDLGPGARLLRRPLASPN